MRRSEGNCAGLKNWGGDQNFKTIKGTGWGFLVSNYGLLDLPSFTILLATISSQIIYHIWVWPNQEAQNTLEYTQLIYLTDWLDSIWIKRKSRCLQWVFGNYFVKNAYWNRLKLHDLPFELINLGNIDQSILAAWFTSSHPCCK